MDLETQNHVIRLLSDIAEDADFARHSDVPEDPDRIRIYLAKILEAVEEINQRIPPAKVVKAEPSPGRHENDRANRCPHSWDWFWK